MKEHDMQMLLLTLCIGADISGGGSTPQPKPKVSASPPSAIVVPPGHHAHRRSDGTVYTHGNENVGNAAAHQGVPLPWPRIAEAGQTVTTSTTAATVQTYTIQQSSCPNGVCPTSGGSSRWYLGKNLGR